ncbi:hypothetical protein ALC57_03531 [Trachymyrmex cornetzi]|uniref:Uncharacterized protein n=1 Tax=Trachymyrmex cornetzi TaxID=471704 RepID=A0A195EH34_9HYME|nr:hypothetical protein ALC57_03531 [Trachymyrmex cornetzi]
MSRFLLDLQNLDWQNQEIANDTPLRGDHPRLRRTGLLDGTKSVSPIDHPRKCILHAVAMRWTPLGFPRALRSFRVEAHAA